MNRQKRIAAIHDVSCFGKCSLTVALPIISAAGIEVSVIPTAVLSTHTGGFTGYTFRDLTEDIMPTAEHWKSIGIGFDAIYTGYVGSIKQIEILEEVFELLRRDETKIIVDPVMADNGVLYKNFTPDFPGSMKRLAQKADVLIPNVTEAVFLLEKPYIEGPYTESYINGILEGLAGFGAKQVVVTGVYFDNDNIGTANFDVEKGSVSYTMANRVEGYYHGTGDVFGSALCAALLRGHTLEDSSRIAVDFTVSSITRTREAGTDVRFGVNFEEGLPDLIAAVRSGDGL
jgi:pyridoxine kinase